MTTKEIGATCEKEVAKYFEQNGIEVIQMNYHCREGEIDIIARDGEYTVFAEVKGRKSSLFGEPCEAVTKTKQRKIYMAAEKYVMENECEGAFRFDVAEVFYETVAGNMVIKSINHIKAAFEGE